jgi:hypothetical protein
VVLRRRDYVKRVRSDLLELAIGSVDHGRRCRNVTMEGARARLSYGFLSKSSTGAGIYRIRFDLDVRAAECNSYPRRI